MQSEYAPESNRLCLLAVEPKALRNRLLPLDSGETNRWVSGHGAERSNVELSGAASWRPLQRLVGQQCHFAVNPHSPLRSLLTQCDEQDAPASVLAFHFVRHFGGAV